MAEDAVSEPAPPAEEAEAADSLVADLRNLAEDTRTALEAELAFQQARAGYAAGAAKGIAIYFALAALLALIALCTLAIGLVLALIPLVGAWAATAIVVGALLAVAVVLGLLGRGAVRRLSRNAFSPDSGS